MNFIASFLNYYAKSKQKNNIFLCRKKDIKKKLVNEWFNEDYEWSRSNTPVNGLKTSEYFLLWLNILEGCREGYSVHFGFVYLHISSYDTVEIVHSRKHFKDFDIGHGKNYET